MPSQLPEHAVVSLLKQCFVTPRCQAPWQCRGALSRSSTRSYHLVRPTIHDEALRVEPRKRCFYTRNRGTRYDGSSHQVNASVLGLTRQRGVNSTPLPFRQKRDYAQGNTAQYTNRIAVLGGGITGLTSAHYLVRELPNAKITVYEGGDRIGGWLQSKYVDVANGKILFEQGPRTLRPSTPSAQVTIEMIQELGLENELLYSSKNSEAAVNRFIYYPDHLVRMPSPGHDDFYSIAWSFLTEPAFKGVIGGVVLEGAREARSSDVEDESVGSFFERRFGGPNIANNLVSAVLHGIYAGDVYQLSAKSLFRRPWDMERQHGSLTSAFLRSMNQNNVPAEDAVRHTRQQILTKKDAELLNEINPKIYKTVQDQMKQASVFTFKEGIGQFSKALETSLRANPNVQFKTGDKVTSVEYDGEINGVQIKTATNQAPEKYTQSISTLSGKTLSTLTSSVPSLANIHAVTVMVVNLYYPTPELLPERGFGYLIPRSIPYQQNPECALGVVFDSDTIHGQDTAPGTKVTVMLGGHWWDGFESYPDEEEGAEMAKRVLRRHLHVEDEPKKVQVGLHRECIPQYVVGHEKRLRMANGELMSGFNGKLKVAGNSYNGVGLNDCVRAARDVVMGIKKGDAGTGLEGFME